MRPPRLPSLRATARYSTSQSRLRPAAARSPASTCVASTRLASDCPPSGRRTLASSLAERTGRRPAALQIRALRPPPRRGPAPISSAPLHRGVPLGSATDSTASVVPLGFHRGRGAPRTRAACLSAAPRSPETRLTRLPCLLCAGAVPNLRTAQAAPLLRLTARQDLLRLETFAVGSTSVLFSSRKGPQKLRSLQPVLPNRGSPLNRDTKDLRGFQWPSRPPSTPAVLLAFGESASGHMRRKFVTGA